MVDPGGSQVWFLVDHIIVDLKGESWWIPVVDPGKKLWWIRVDPSGVSWWILVVDPG